MAALVTGCGAKSLNAKTFTDVAKDYGFSVTDSKAKANGMDKWIVGKDKHGGTVQFVSFKSSGSAGEFFKTQSKQISDQTGAPSSGGTMSTTYAGYYYYLTRKGDAVILATVPSENTDAVKGLIQDLPDPE